MAAIMSRKCSQKGVNACVRGCRRFFKLLEVISSKAFYCARGKKWVMDADLAPLIFQSKEAIHVYSAKIFPATVRDKLLVKTSNRLFKPQC